MSGEKETTISKYDYHISCIDENGEQYISFYLEPQKLNDRGLIDGVRAANITLNHIKQTSTISLFTWVNGAPKYWREIKTIKDEIIDVSEIPNLLKTLKI